jgi:hypothetical protein
MPMASEDEANFGGWIYSNALEIVQRFGAPGYWIDTGIYREPITSTYVDHQTFAEPWSEHGDL